MQDQSSIFVSYANPDQARVIPFYNHLRSQGFNVWMDCRNLKPGQDWAFEIARALEKADFVLAFLSKSSVDRRGYVQRELKAALDKRSEKLADDIYLVPVLLDDDIQIPDQLRGLQYVRASSVDCNTQIVGALNHQLERLGVERTRAQEQQGIRWESRVLREAWDGFPGFEVELQYLEFRSERYPRVSEMADYIKGRLLSRLFEHRAQMIDQTPGVFSGTEDKYRRTNTYDAHCADPIVVGRLLSIQYSIHWYGAGAAHPNMHFETYAFLLEPPILIESLASMFSEPDSSLSVLQGHARRILYQVRVRDDPDDQSACLDREWVDRGTSTWEDFRAFRFTREGLDILFAPYQVASYACGPQFAMIPMAHLVPLLRSEYVTAMQLGQSLP